MDPSFLFCAATRHGGDPDHFCGRQVLVSFDQLSQHVLGGLLKGLLQGTVLLQGHRVSYVSGLANALHQRNLPEQLGIEVFGQVFCPVFSKDIILEKRSTAVLLDASKSMKIGIKLKSAELRV